MMLSLLGLGVLLSATPVDEAKAQLKAGKLDEVLFALDGQKLDATEKPKAAQVLGDAAQAAWAKNDVTLALQFAQMALKLEPAQVQALEAGSRAAFSQQQFEIADSYANRWLDADPKNAEAHVYRGELAIEAGEWQRALDVLQGVKFDSKQQKRADAVTAKAGNELSQRKAAISTLGTLERQLAIAQEKAAQHAGSSRPTYAAPARTNQVVLYGTSWCPYCKQARAFFQRRHVDFVEKDVEREPAAAEELARKAVAAGVQPNGVPVIDVRGKLILGWSESEVEQALSSR